MVAAEDPDDKKLLSAKIKDLTKLGFYIKMLFGDYCNREWLCFSSPRHDEDGGQRMLNVQVMTSICRRSAVRKRQFICRWKIVSLFNEVYFHMDPWPLKELFRVLRSRLWNLWGATSLVLWMSLSWFQPCYPTWYPTTNSGDNLLQSALLVGFTAFYHFTADPSATLRMGSSLFIKGGSNI